MRRLIPLLSLAVIAAAIITSSAPGVSAQGNRGIGRFTFALIGDMPYGARGDAQFPAVIDDINADKQVSFVVHDGDIKNGSSLCDDAMFYDRLALFNTFDAPFIYIPGDNEWTDCHRANNGGYDPLERLDFLRAVFFPSNLTLGRRPVPITRQSESPAYAAYRENVRWTSGGVMFVGLHIVGSNNNLGRTASADAEYLARNAANIVWLDQAFAAASSANARAVMIVIQANPNFELPATDPERTGFNDFLAQLEARTRAFGKPVVLVHGDSHYFRIDKPMVRTSGPDAGIRVEDFTRVETFGQNDNHWLHVAVEPNDPSVFQFSQRIVAANRAGQ